MIKTEILSSRIVQKITIHILTRIVQRCWCLFSLGLFLHHRLFPPLFLIYPQLMKASCLMCLPHSCHYITSGPVTAK